MMIMIVIVIGLLRTILFGFYRHQRWLVFTWSRLQGRKYNIRIAKLAFHAKESPIQTRDGVSSLVSSRSNSPDDVYSPAVRIPPNPGLPQRARPLSHGFLDDPPACTPSLLDHNLSKNRAAEDLIPFGLRLIFLFFEILKQAIKQQYGLGLRLLG